MVVAYDGAPFRGFAVNDGVRTVMGELGAAVATVVRAPVELTGAGRTDAGVHGWGQVVSGDLPATTDLDGLVRRLNKLCAPAIAVRDATVGRRRLRRPLLGLVAPLPLRRLERPDAQPAAGRPRLVRAPARCSCGRCRRRVTRCSASTTSPRSAAAPSRRRDSRRRRWCVGCWRPAGTTSTVTATLLRFEIRANAFCHQMVRSIVGTLVDVGLGKASPGDVRGIMIARDREAAGQVAPPHGLVLWEVGYPPV